MNRVEATHEPRVHVIDGRVVLACEACGLVLVDDVDAGARVTPEGLATCPAERVGADWSDLEPPARVEPQTPPLDYHAEESPD